MTCAVCVAGRNSVKRAAWLATAALAAALAPFPPAWVDTVYSSGVYPCLQAPVTSTSNLAPFALFDALVLTVAAAWLAALAVDVRRAGRGRAHGDVGGGRLPSVPAALGLQLPARAARAQARLRRRRRDAGRGAPARRR